MAKSKLKDENPPVVEGGEENIINKNQEQVSEPATTEVVTEQPALPATEAEEIAAIQSTSNNTQATNVDVDVKGVTQAENVLSDEELIKQTNPTTGFSPFKNQRIVRDYVDSGAGKSVERVPEPEFKKPIGNTAGGVAGNTSSASSATSSTVASTATVAITPEQQKNESEMLVNALIGAYRQANDLGGWMVKVDESKLIEWELDDLIDPEMLLPVGPNGQKVTPRTFFAAFAVAVDEAKAIPDNYFDDVKVSMVREFIKRGIGLSDMANIIQFFTRDILMRGGNFYSLYRQRVINTKQLQSIWADQKEIKRIAQQGSEPETPVV
jgi:hypothetical protein